MSNYKMLVLAVTLAAFSLQGCSVFGMVSPPIQHQDMEEVDCSWRKVWPVLDLNTAVGGAYGLLLGLAADDTLLSVVGGAVLAIGAGSSLYGYGLSERCREARIGAHLRAVDRDRRQHEREYRALKHLARSSGGHFQDDGSGSANQAGSVVSRARESSTGKIHAVAEFRFRDGVGVRFHARPDERGGPAQVNLALWMDAARHNLRGCKDLSFLVNASRVEVTPSQPRSKGRRSAVTGTFSAEALDKLNAPVPSVGLTHCSLALSFNAEQIDALRSFRLVLQDLAKDDSTR